MRSRTQLAAKYRKSPGVAADADYLNPYEVAALLRVTERTLRNWRAARKGPFFIKHGSTIRYPKSSLSG
jgi:hypothetical protein